MGADQRHIAFLRAVNVGDRKVEMARLREVLTGLGFDAVGTYLASGNTFFTCPDTDRAALVERVEAALAETFGFTVPTIVRTVPELKAELAASPFVGRRPATEERFFMVFAAQPPTDGEIPLRSAKGDWEILGTHGSTVFAVWRLDHGRAGNPLPQIEKRLRVRATGRFFHTTEKILAAAERA